MDSRDPRRQAGFNRRQLRRPEPITSRPDRFALWAVVLAVVAMLAAAGSSHAFASGGGGTGVGGSANDESQAPGCLDANLGERELGNGDCGTDVETLNWVLNSKEFGLAAPLGEDFDSSTEEAVGSLQKVAGLRSTGVFDESTRAALVASMRPDVASYYGPGFYGNELACGGTLKRTTVGVAHRTLPCGSKVTIKYRGHFLRTKVIDRGPFVQGVKWDLTSAAASQVGLQETTKVRSAIVR